GQGEGGGAAPEASQSHLTLPALRAGPLPLPRKQAAERGLLPELGRPPSYCGRDALGGDDFTELGSDFGLGRVELAADVESGVERGAKACSVGGAVDRALGRGKRFRRNQRQPL